MEALTELHPIYFTEPELLDWVKLHAQFYVKRYQEGKGEHWKKGEKRNTFVGLVGQKIFDILLQQLEVFGIHNDPVIDWRGKKDYDFLVNQLGSIEVKTFDYYCEYALIKLKEWHGNDYAVIFKFEDEAPTTVTMNGYLTKEEVESLPIAKKGEKKFSQLATCYYCRLDDTQIHPANEFITMLLNTKT